MWGGMIIIENKSIISRAIGGETARHNGKTNLCNQMFNPLYL
jgi:hypothetical protein